MFFDDILIYSNSLQAHLGHLESVFHTLSDGKFYMKHSKCLIAQRQLEYLGHIVSHSGVAPDPSKISAMTDWPIPTSVKAPRGFLGLTGFYRKFIKAYASIAAPLTALLRKDSFKWSPEAQTAFEALKLQFWHSQTSLYLSTWKLMPQGWRWELFLCSIIILLLFSVSLFVLVY